VTVVPSDIEILLGSKARFLIITVTAGPGGTGVVLCCGEVPCFCPAGGTTQPQMSTIHTKAITRIAYPFMKRKKGG
jgi:hypothetical protein